MIISYVLEIGDHNEVIVAELLSRAQEVGNIPDYYKGVATGALIKHISGVCS